MKDLFSRIARQLPENLTTEVLNYVLQNSTSCLTKFLKLLNSTAKPESISSKTQYSANGGFVDLELESNDKSTIIFVENKPWSTLMVPFVRQKNGGEQGGL